MNYELLVSPTAVPAVLQGIPGQFTYQGFDSYAGYVPAQLLGLPGGFALAGQTAQLTSNFLLSPGAFTLTGVAVKFPLGAQPGAFAFTGAAAALLTNNVPAVRTLAALPNAIIGTPYTTSIAMIAGAGGPYTAYAMVDYSSSRSAASGVSTAPTPLNIWSINSSTGALTCTPAGAETDYFLISAKDNTSTTVQQYFACTVSASTNTLVIATPVNLGFVQQGQVYNAGAPFTTLVGVGGSGALSWWLVSQSSTGTDNGWAVNSSTGAITGTATNTGTNTLNLSVTDGTNTTTGFVCLTVRPYVTAAPRPAYNTGAGLFVRDGEVYDSNGNVVRLRGYNRLHSDQPNSPNIGSGIRATGASAIRSSLYPFSPYTEAGYVSYMQQGSINSGAIPIAMRYYGSSGSSTSTGSPNLGMQQGANATGLGYMVQNWANVLSTYTPIMNQCIINVANEWGPGNSINFLYAYQAVSGTISNISGTKITLSNVSGTNPFANSLGLTIGYLSGSTGNINQVITITAVGGVSGAWTVTAGASLNTSVNGTLWGGAIGILRAAGYTCPIMIDSGTYGQDYSDLTNYAVQIWNSDPQKNLIFSYHLYGNTSSLSTLTNALSIWTGYTQTYGIPFVIGEFGPYNLPAGGASLTHFPTQQLIGIFEQYGVGWLPWALDNNNLGGFASDDGTWCMRYKPGNTDTGLPSARTVFGKMVMNDPRYGLLVGSQQATAP